MGHAVIRDENTKNILSIQNKQDLLLFIIRVFSNMDSLKLLDAEIQKLKISRAFESIHLIYEEDPLYKALLLFKTEKVKSLKNSCRSSLSSKR